MIQINMEKPNHCLHCPMCNGDDDCVLIQEIDTSWDWEEQYANCPLQEVKPERKKGTWELMFNGQFKGGAYWFSCSKCNRIVPEVRNGGWNYCPNCGADMRGEQDG